MKKKESKGELYLNRKYTARAFKDSRLNNFRFLHSLRVRFYCIHVNINIYLYCVGCSCLFVVSKFPPG